MNEIAAIDHTGDTKKFWDPNDPEQVAEARGFFTALKAEGYAAYRIDEDGVTGEVLQEFDPRAARIVMRPPMKGG
jgi:hypothetical protein